MLLQTLRTLQPVLKNILQQQTLNIHVKGLEYMNDDPSAMHVAYVGVQDPAQQQGCVQKLQQLCTAVVDAFSDAGLLLSRDERYTPGRLIWCAHPLSKLTYVCPS